MYQRRSPPASAREISSRNKRIMHSSSSGHSGDSPRSAHLSWTQWLIQMVRWCWSWLVSNVFPKTINGPRIVFDTGRVVRQGRQIAEGGFSYVFEATDVSGGSSSSRNRYRSSPKTFALKRVMLADRDMLDSVRKEVGVHRSVKHANLMPLLGFSLQEHNTVAYLLFPYLPHSLRSEVNQRMFGDHTPSPWPETTALNIFLQVLQGVSALHHANYTHRDLKLENILLRKQKMRGARSSTSNISSYIPVIMDFGSSGPLTQAITTRRHVLELAEEASQHTTLPYRPPELLEGGVRAGDSTIDFTLVDVWSLGCTLFAILYGSSPMECEVRHNRLTICDCTPLRILSGLPTLPDTLQQWYSHDTYRLIQQMLNPNRQNRIPLREVIIEVERILEELGERIAPAAATQTPGMDEDEEGDMSALLGQPSSYV